MIKGRSKTEKYEDRVEVLRFGSEVNSVLDLDSLGAVPGQKPDGRGSRNKLEE